MKKGAALGDAKTKPGSSGFAAWFHGILTREQSESLLGKMPQGGFLVRVSESRFGYSLSFKHNDRIKHFMIDQTPDGRYLVVGNDRTFPGLNELVYFHSTHPLTEDGDLLTHPCPAQAENLAEFM
jgi:myosin-3